ncbi:MAG: DUF3549 family protein [Gammaproteobacteria bacterium]|jgi:hypothetical protein|nr:DUF3549 family protein [Gammaproteobacteria bacterium]
MQPAINSLQTLSDLFNQVDGHYRIFDIGCRLTKLTATQFHAFENSQKPYPLPWLRHAWLGILLWQTQRQEAAPTIWFLKFPLDEQGYLVQAARDEFLNQLLETIGTNMLERQESAAIGDKLQHSNLAFTPDQERMAAFNAQARSLLKQSPSAFYQPVRQYILAAKQGDNWQQLGIQGFADLAQRLVDDELLAQAVVKSLDGLPTPVLVSLAIQCENVILPHQISKAFLQRGQQTQDAGERIACLRAVSQAPNSQARQDWLLRLLAGTPIVDVELLAVVASKCQADLRERAVLMAFVEACAVDQGVFNGLVGELMYQQDLRLAILHLMRSPQRSDRLAAAFGALLQAQMA